MAHLCARCDHFCDEGILFKRKGEIYFRCSGCNHRTTMVKVAELLEDDEPPARYEGGPYFIKKEN